MSDITIQTNTNTTTQPTSDHCTTCIWLDRQPLGNSMLCIMPGACEWSMNGFDTLRKHTPDK